MNHSREPRWTLSTVLALVFTLLGCSAKSVVKLDPALAIINQTGRIIADIQYQACDGNNNPWLSVYNSKLAPGAGVTITYPANCVNMAAYFADGKMAGKQTDIHSEFPFRWVLY